MINYFRKIRKKLADDNKFFKYSRYALGEILLVVVGILIALQINNWNEDRKEQIQIKMYLRGLVETLNDDISYLEYTQSGNTFRSKCIKHLLFLSNEEASKPLIELKYELDSTYLINKPGIAHIDWTIKWNEPIPKSYNREFTEKCFERTAYGNIIVVNQSTFEEFKNTGLFSYMQNEELKKSINEYYSNMKWQFSDWREVNFREEIDEWEDFLRDKYKINYFDLSHISDPIGLIKDNKDLQLEMELLANTATGRANSAGDIRLKAKELINLIESELLKI